YFIIFFFFSSRRRHTRFSRDWSSDVCSSDLPALATTTSNRHLTAHVTRDGWGMAAWAMVLRPRSIAQVRLRGVGPTRAAPQQSNQSVGHSCDLHVAPKPDRRRFLTARPSSSRPTGFE